MHIFELSVFGFQIAPTWYGLMYALGFTFCYIFVKLYSTIQQKHLDTLLTYIFFWVIWGGRLGYIILYNPILFMENPLEILAIWNGGMSFHGGLLWVLIASFIFGKIYNYKFFELTDILAVCLPVALGLGRIGNWINQELPWYTPYDGPFAMTIHWVKHFPSPLLEMVLEGIVLFGILFSLWYSGRLGILKLKPWFLGAIFLIWYSIARLIAENFRLPDSHVGYLWGTDWMTLGIAYTIPMLISWISILLWSTKKTSE